MTDGTTGGLCVISLSETLLARLIGRQLVQPGGRHLSPWSPFRPRCQAATQRVRGNIVADLRRQTCLESTRTYEQTESSLEH